jgi:hypothetical protein
LQFALEGQCVLRLVNEKAPGGTPPGAVAPPLPPGGTVPAVAIIATAAASPTASRPHKPLLVLYALGRWGRGDPGAIPFRNVDRDLTPMLKEFGPRRQSYHPEYPFWRSQNDGVSAVTAAGPPQ